MHRGCGGHVRPAPAGQRRRRDLKISTRAAPNKVDGSGGPALLGTGPTPDIVRTLRAGKCKGKGRCLPFGEALVFVRGLRLTGESRIGRRGTGPRRDLPTPHPPRHASTRTLGGRGCGTSSARAPWHPSTEWSCPSRRRLCSCVHWGPRAWAEEPGGVVRVVQKWRVSNQRAPQSGPSLPAQRGWQECGHWLGTVALASANQACLSFNKALAVVRSPQLKNAAEWAVWSKIGTRPVKHPGNPNKTYRHSGWQAYGHWLGTSNRSGRRRGAVARELATVACAARTPSPQPSRKRPAAAQAAPGRQQAAGGAGCT